MNATGTLEEAKQAVIDDFSMYDEWLDKYEYLIELGKDLEAYPEDARTDDHLIKGCQSRVWLDWKVENGALQFRADSDAIITKGIISLLIRVYSRQRPGFHDRDHPPRRTGKPIENERKQRNTECRRRERAGSPV